MTLSRTGLPVGLAVAAALALTACGSNNNSTTSAGGGASTAASTGASTAASGGASAAASGSCATGSLTAAGSTAQKNAVDEWVKNYQRQCSGATINYQGVGSGAGVQQFTAGSIAFAGSDSALKPAEHTAAAKTCGGNEALDLPMVVGPIALAYKVAGVSSLVLDAPTIAAIFSGAVTKWNDPAIAKLNPGAKLPSEPVQAFHRSDSSGTTDNFQKYLTAAAPGAWTTGAGKTFSGKGGQGAKGSDGVTQAVSTTEGAIAYTEYSFAQNANLPTVKIATGAAQPVALSTDSAAKAIASAKVTGTGSDLTLKIDYATKAAGAYPIVLVTYEIACAKGGKSVELVKSFLTYTSSTAGQGVLSGLGYAPLPEGLRAKVASTVATLS